MRSILITIIILAVLGAAIWLLLGSPEQTEGFRIQALSSKVVYTLLDSGSVSDLRKDCAVREGSFNSCGSMCESGEVCATVCAYTCEFITDPVEDEADEPIVVKDDIECGIKNDGTTVQCPFSFTCFTYDGSDPSCNDDPCSVCGESEECLQLESYPVQIRCTSSPLEKGGDEGGEEIIPAEDTNDPSPTLPLPRGEGDISVSSPTPNETVTSPINVTGEARVFEGTVIIHVTTLSGDVLIEEVATAHAPDVGQFGSYSAKINYSFSATKEGFVKVFSESARDGSVENLVEIPVKFN